MKSTYKLFGEYWDGLPSYGSVEVGKSNELYTNTLLFSKLLALNDKDSFEEYIFHLKGYNNIIICIDYWTDNSNHITNAFLEKRLSQMVFQLHKYFEEVCCVVNSNY